VTAIVRSAHKLVERVDGILLRDLDLEPYLREALRRYLTEDGDAKLAGMMARASNAWGRSPDRRRSTIRQIALNNGFTVHRDGAPNELTMAAIDGLANLSPSEAVRTLINSTPEG
jgi:hypothetical protein